MRYLPIMQYGVRGLLTAWALTTQLAWAEPTIDVQHIQRIQMHYSVTKNGQPFANVKESFVVSNQRYTIESITKGVGVYALFGERKLISQGELTAAGLKPKRFELQQGDHPKKALSADFDWAANVLNMTVKGRLKTAPLTPGAQDLASYGYQFMYLAKPLDATISVAVTTGKKLNTYTYAISPTSVSMQAGDAIYDTMLLTERGESEASTVEEKSLWLSKAHHYLPIRIKFVDDEGVELEQTLTSLTIE